MAAAHNLFNCTGSQSLPLSGGHSSHFEALLLPVCGQIYNYNGDTWLIHGRRDSEEASVGARYISNCALVLPSPPIPAAVHQPSQDAF